MYQIVKTFPTDESRKADKVERADDNRPRWLLAFDCHYFIHRHYHSGAGVETAKRVSEWAKRTIDRLKLKEFDRQIGAIFGLAKGVLWCAVITFFTVTLSFLI